jgi:pimeloyl-ACP methyl ester carboxylesterase
MKWLRYLGRGLAGIAALLVAAFIIQAWIDRDIPAAELEARYMTPASRFLNVDGVRIHYRDEGSGPALVLIHANFGNLIGWDPWVEVLKDRYRVLRFDLTAHGLTGPDPSGDYSLERTIALTGRFVDALGLKRFSIGGTSLGGTVAIYYTAAHPDRVDRLVLLSPGALEGRAMDRAGRTVPAAANILQWITPRALPAYMLRSRFGDPANVSDALIDQWHDMWRREGQRRAMLARLRSYSSANIVTGTAGVRVPTLILWGAANPQAPVEQAEELRAMLVNAPAVRVITYPGVGHMAVEEAGLPTGQDVRAFLDAPVTGAPPPQPAATPPAPVPPAPAPAPAPAPGPGKATTTIS